MLYLVIVDAMSALAEPRRRNIVELLARKGELTASEIYRRFTVTAQAVSQHLRVLLDAQLVKMEKRSQQHIYSLNPSAIRDIEHWARSMNAQWNESLDRLAKVLEEEKKEEE